MTLKPLTNQANLEREAAACTFCGFTKPSAVQAQKEPTVIVVRICEECFTSTTPEAQMREMARAVIEAGAENDPTRPVMVNVMSRS